MLKPTLLLVISLVLAGCGAPAPATSEETFEDLDFGEVAATETTGVIRGVVIDLAIRPVAGVLVNLTGTELAKTTGDDGSFAFAGLQPGTYFLQASKLGYSSLQGSAEVVAGVDEPPIVKLQMIADPSTAPRVVLYHLDGYIECSVRPMILALQCGFSSGDVVNAEYDLEAIPDWIQSEMVWTSTQATGDELSLSIRCLVQSERCPEGQLTIVRSEGASPRIATINRTTSEFWALGAPDGDPLSISIFAFGRSDLDFYDEETVDGAQEPITGKPCLDWSGILFPPGTCVRMTGPGLIVNQKVDVYTHVFYGFLPEEGWTFGVDGAPAPPRP